MGSPLSILKVVFPIMGMVAIALVGWAFLIDVPPSAIFGKSKSRPLPDWVKKTPIAHRGLHSDTRPENTLAAFEAAVKDGFAIELDVQFTKDQQLVVFHDADLVRLTGDLGMVKDKTLAELRELRVLGTTETIPTLNDVFDLVNGKVPLYIELKTEHADPDVLAESVYAELQNYDGPLSVISFDPAPLAWFKVNAPEILRGQTSYAFDSERNQREMSFASRWVHRNYLMNWRSRPDFIVNELKETPRQNVQFIHKHKPLLLFRVKKVEDLALAEAGADNVIFDHIGQKLKQRRVPATTIRS